MHVGLDGAPATTSLGTGLTGFDGTYRWSTLSYDNRPAGGGSFVTLGTAKVVSMKQNPGAVIHLRAHVVGAGPTTIRMRAWADGTTEPTTWRLARTDDNAAPQDAGWLGVRAVLTSGEHPAVFAFDDLLATTVAL